MEKKMENEFLIIKSRNKGAELISIKDKIDGTEYLWTGASLYWGRHAPILFPIVGKVKDGNYSVGDKVYKMGQHGFARDLEFKVIESTKESVLYRLLWNEDTLKIYPYRFELNVRYTLKERTIDIGYTVRNADSDDIHFSIGAHPGFNCPLLGSKASEEDMCFEDYYFEFAEYETASIIPLSSSGFLSRERIPYLKDSKIINLSPELFKNDALIFDNLKSHRISLKNTKNAKTIMMDFKGFPYLGLWSKPGGAPFVCIEPWFGHTDFDDFSGDFTEKEDMQMLKMGEEFHCSYSVTMA